MDSHKRAVLSLSVLVVLLGCASTKVTQETPMTAPGLARPNKIWVYDFVASAADVPSDSSIASTVGAPSERPTPDQIQTGRQLGALIADDLVADIQAMGLPAVHAVPGTSPQVFCFQRRREFRIQVCANLEES